MGMVHIWHLVAQREGTRDQRKGSRALEGNLTAATVEYSRESINRGSEVSTAAKPTIPNWDSLPSLSLSSLLPT